MKRLREASKAICNDSEVKLKVECAVTAASTERETITDLWPVNLLISTQATSVISLHLRQYVVVCWDYLFLLYNFIECNI